MRFSARPANPKPINEMSIKNHLTLLASSFALANCLAGTTSILIDLGKPDLLSSAETDPNGYHWNNIAPDPEAINGVMGWELLTNEQKAAYSNPGAHYLTPGLLPYTLIADAVEQTGLNTGVSVILSEVTDVADYTNAGGPFGRAGEEYGDDFGPIPTQTGYAPTATIDGFYVNWEFESLLTITGLDDARTYTLKMWGGYFRESAPTSWIVNGDVAGEQTIETYQNTGANPEDYAIFENVSPVGGIITVQYEQGVENVGTPKGHWSTLEIIGDFSGGETWMGYSVRPDGYVDTTPWMGWVSVDAQPWIWVVNLNRYAYIVDESGWMFLPKP